MKVSEALAGLVAAFSPQVEEEEELEQQDEGVLRMFVRIQTVASF